MLAGKLFRRHQAARVAANARLGQQLLRAISQNQHRTNVGGGHQLRRDPHQRHQRWWVVRDLDAQRNMKKKILNKKKQKQKNHFTLSMLPVSLTHRYDLCVHLVILLICVCNVFSVQITSRSGLSNPSSRNHLSCEPKISFSFSSRKSFSFVARKKWVKWFTEHPAMINSF